MLPNFLVVGSQKCGTTSLRYFFQQHPDIFMPEEKVINFFKSSTENYNRGLKWYEAHFDAHKGERAVGEISPRYMFFKDVPARIAEVNKDMKLIFLLRNPVDRAYSHYWHSVRDGDEFLSFEHALAKENERIKLSQFAARAYSYTKRGLYFQQIVNFLDYFPKEQMLFLFSEELIANQKKILQETFRFLGIDSTFELETSDQIKNIGKGVKSKWAQKYLIKSKPMLVVKKIMPLIHNSIASFNIKDTYPLMDKRVRNQLIKYFSEENKKLSKLINKDLSFWDL